MLHTCSFSSVVSEAIHKAKIVVVYRGDVVEMDTWVAGSGKNGMRRDWLVRDYKTGQILARATRWVAC